MLDKNKAILYCDRIILTCLCLLIFCLPFAKAGVETFLWLAIFIWLLKRALGYRGEALWEMLPKTPLNRALGIFIAINAISMILSANLSLSLRGFFGKELKFMAIYFMLVETVNNRKRLKILLGTIIASAALISSDAAIQYYKGADFLRGYPAENLRASFPSANAFGAWLIVVIPLFIGMLLAGKVIINRVLKILLSALIIGLLICLLNTCSRGAWLGFAIGFFPMFYYIVIKHSPLTIKAISLVLGICLFLMVLFLPRPVKAIVKDIGHINFKFTQWTVGERIKSIAKVSTGTNLVRIKLWKESLMIVRDFPFFGSGLNTYSIVARRYKSFEGGGVYPHNSYLQMAAETGILGLFAFLWILFRFFKIGFSYLNQKKDFLVLGLLSGVLAFLVHGFFDTHLYSLQLIVLFWFIIGLTVAVTNIEPCRQARQIEIK